MGAVDNVSDTSSYDTRNNTKQARDGEGEDHLVLGGGTDGGSHAGAGGEHLSGHGESHYVIPVARVRRRQRRTHVSPGVVLCGLEETKDVFSYGSTQYFNYSSIEERTYGTSSTFRSTLTR